MLEELMTYRKVRTVRSVILLYSILYYASARPSSGHESHYITTTTYYNYCTEPASCTVVCIVSYTTNKCDAPPTRPKLGPKVIGRPVASGGLQNIFGCLRVGVMDTE